MKTPIKINLNKVKQCDQVWEDMAIHERGRICKKCAKHMVDFRPMKEDEIAILHAQSDVGLCGVYSNQQIHGMPRKRSRKRVKALGIIGWLTATQVAAQENASHPMVHQADSLVGLDENKKEVIERRPSNPADSLIIYGRTITMASEEPLPFCTVLIKNSETGCSSDADGNYILNVTEAFDTTDVVTIVYSYIGMGKLEKTIDRSFFNGSSLFGYDAMLEENEELVVFYISVKKPWYKRLWGRVRSVFR